MKRETQKQKLARLDWALQRITAITAIPEDKRSDLDWLRSVCMLAHTYATAGRLPALDDPPGQGPQDGRLLVGAPNDQST